MPATYSLHRAQGGRMMRSSQSGEITFRDCRAQRSSYLILSQAMDAISPNA
jgi:hypothetical protein